MYTKKVAQRRLFLVNIRKVLPPCGLFAVRFTTFAGVTGTFVRLVKDLGSHQTA
jgi:hypothetical protein